MTPSKNYSLMLEEELKKLRQEGRVPRLLLQVCCAPCSSYVLEYLSEYFDITLYFYNPNISPAEENDFRARELERLTREMPLSRMPKIVVAPYEPEKFYDAVRGMEDLPEGGARCAVCYRLRLQKTAVEAAKGGYDYFCTTLSISPHKRADWLNAIGGELEEKYGVKYLYSDFKKKNGYKRSLELSREYDLYRQNYCGCEFSRKEAENRQ